MNKVKSIHFKGYKSFSDDKDNAFYEIKNVNVIIGKNNSGKSSVIDILEYVIDFQKFQRYINNFKVIEIGFDITKEIIRKNNMNKSSRYFSDYYEQFIGKEIRLKEINKDAIFPKYISENQNDIFKMDKEYLDGLANQYTSFFNGYKFRRLNSERDITREGETIVPVLQVNGNGATQIIKKFLTDSNFDDRIIEDNLLNKLNDIMAPDSEFIKIKIKHIVNGEWEIFLEEKNNKKIALSQCGSGLKTIILVLLNLLVVPETKEYKNKRIVFAFEELENNLYPALQRRLFKYIYDYAVKKDVSVF